jgi:hypothetical protein
VLVQLAAVACWMVGLESSIYRMQVVPGVLLGVFAAVLVGWIWVWTGGPGRPGPLVRGLLVLGVLAMGARGVHTAHWNAKRSIRSVGEELELVQQVAACTDCRWWLEPRQGLGTRDRHDGCEILQGLTELRHGEDFWCAAWMERGQVPPGVTLTHRARWEQGEYRVDRLTEVESTP